MNVWSPYERKLETFYNLLLNPGPKDRVYVYRMDGDAMEKPALYKGTPFEDLDMHIQAEFGGGIYCFLFRRGKTIIFRIEYGIARRPDDPRKPAAMSSL